MEDYVNSDVVRGDHLDAEVTDINDDMYANVEAFKPETRDEAGQQTSSRKRCWALGLGTLGLLLLFVIITLSIHYTMKEKDQLQGNDETLRAELDALTKERDQLKARSNNLMTEKDQLRTSYDTLTKERDALTKERDQLKASSNNLMTEKDQLQSHYDTLSASRDALQQEVDRLKLVQNCPQGWEKFGCSCYYKSSESKTWSESRDDCANKGAHLVIINSREEQVFVNQFAVRAWIGLSDGEDEGKWKWVDGSPLVCEGFWRNGEPNDADGGEDCAGLIDGVGTWNDMPCMESLTWICEKVNKN